MSYVEESETKLETGKNSKESKESVGRKPTNNSATNLRRKIKDLELARLIIAVNLHARVLNNNSWKNFVMKYMGKYTIPDEPTLWNNCLNDLYNSVLENIRRDIKDQYVWISINETINDFGQCITNVVIGKLGEDEATKPHLLYSEEVKRINDENIVRLVYTAMKIVLPKGHEEKVLLLITNSEQYMLRAGRRLKSVYSDMIHVTCLVHGLQQIAEEVRGHFPLVQSLIFSVNKIFVEAPRRVEKYREQVRDTLPPKPIFERPGTWIEAATFYDTQYDKIKEVVKTFKKEDAKVIEVAQTKLQSVKLPRNLGYIKTHFKILSETIQKLENGNLTLNESITIYNTCTNSFKTLPDEYDTKVKDKLNAIRAMNPGLRTFCDISRIFNNETTDKPTNLNERMFHIWKKYKYAPVTLCNMEKAFPGYKVILNDEARRLKPDFEKMLVTYANIN